MGLFSVVIPCYNCINTLEATVNSVQLSGLTDYEILLIDDGSNDGTGDLCDDLCQRYTEVRCVHQENAGVSAARNRGIDNANGEYLWFVDADDTVDSGALSHAVSVINRRQPDMLLLMEDFLFVLELLPYCQSIYSLKEPIYRYRQAEDEKGAYRRLQRITDLAAFMQPIADCIQQFNISDQNLMTKQIYAMLFQQSLAYAPLKQIQLRLILHCNGKYADAFIAENACKIWVQYRLSHMRHKVAVFIKSRNMLLKRKICG